MSRRNLAMMFALACVALVAACGSNPPPPQNNQPFPTTAARPTAMASANASASASAPALVFNPEDFTTSDRNRDPFRSYVEIFSADAPGKKGPTVQVSADRFSLDELKLVAIITGNAAPRAMFVDPEGKGWIVTLGQLIGRSELVKAGGSGGAEYDLNWRVDRIREGDVVFVRENPGRANIPTATRVIALRPEGDQTTQRVRLATGGSAPSSSGPGPRTKFRRRASAHVQPRG